MFDTVIRGGTVVDGTGAPAREADVALLGGKIAAVGPNLGPGREEIDARGRVVTPGWVDMHTHYDGQVTWDPHLTPSGWHGVTTVVMGNCGVGFAPVRPASHDWLIQVMEGVEDIPGSALSEGIRWGWESFPEYLDTIEKLPLALDVGAQIPHAALRGYVMGEDRSEDEGATAAEVARMKDLVKEALLAGALGFTTSRTSLHKTAKGKFVAGTFAPVDELFGIGEALRETGLGVFECAGEHVMMAGEIDWMERLATTIDRPVLFNLSQTDFAPDLWAQVLAKLEAAADRGAPLWAQCAGRAIGILMNWRVTAHPFVLHPTFQALSGLPWPELLTKLKDPEIRARILAEKPVERGVFEAYITGTFDKMFPLVDPSRDYEPEPAASLGARARATGADPKALAYDAMLEADGTRFLYFPLFNYANGNLDLLHRLHGHPRTHFGLSDGGAHCGAICDGGMPTFMLTHWARDRRERHSLEAIVHRQTQKTAALYGLMDRGVLAPGYRADVNVIDLDRLALLPPAVATDLPAGGRRLVQDAVGYDVTFVAGVATMRAGTPTGAMPGKLVRGPQALA